jgi:hypothetical protein
VRTRPRGPQSCVPTIQTKKKKKKSVRKEKDENEEIKEPLRNDPFSIASIFYLANIVKGKRDREKHFLHVDASGRVSHDDIGTLVVKVLELME